MLIEDLRSMPKLTLEVEEEVYDRAQEYASYHGRRLETLLIEHVTEIAKTGGRRLTLREKTYRDHGSPEEVVEQLRMEACAKGHER